MVVIGAGAAGMMTAVKASEHYSVTILEKNEKPGKKLYITGKGRCNLTNDCDQDTFLKNVVRNPKFLYSAIHAYDSEAVQRDFQTWGLAIQTERGNRVFPVSGHASDVIRTLEHTCLKNHVHMIYGAEVTEILTRSLPEASAGEKGRAGSSVTGVRTRDGKVYPADVVVAATGGLSYPSTGSTGDGLRMIQKLGVTVTSCVPSLVGMDLEGQDAPEMAGLSLKNVAVTVTTDPDVVRKWKKPRKIYSGFGEMLFTHTGASGPLILSASAYACRDFLPDGMWLSLDLKPALSEEMLDQRIQRDFRQEENRTFMNSLGGLLPRLLIPVVVRRSGISPDKKVNQVTHRERQELVRVLKHLDFRIRKFRGFSEAVITSGGVAVKELDPRTMEVKKIRGLRCAGEMIDCDALTGGFNLQIAWCTAAAAGRAVYEN